MAENTVSDVDSVATVCTLFASEPSPLRTDSTDVFVLSTLAGTGVVSKESELLRLFASAQIWTCPAGKFPLNEGFLGVNGEPALLGLGITTDSAWTSPSRFRSASLWQL